jgi:hypothetical protein
MTTAESLTAAVTIVENAMDNLLQAVQARLVEVARAEGITRMDFTPMSEFFCGDDQVECPALDDIDAVYLRFHRGGFIAYWTEAEGWTVDASLSVRIMCRCTRARPTSSPSSPVSRPPLSS